MRFSIFVALLAACETAPSGGGDSTNPTGDPEPGGMPWAQCVEASREAVTDLEAVPAGFVDAPAAVFAANAGDWSGPWSQYGDESPVGLTATLSFDGTATAVFLEENEGSGGTGYYEPLGAPTATGVVCAPYYELAGTLTLVSDDGRLADSFPVVVTASGADDPSLGGDILQEDMIGTADTSMEGDWENVYLSIWMSRYEGGNFEGSMQWSGQGPTDPNPGPSSTSVAFAEPYGSFSLVLVP